MFPYATVNLRGTGMDLMEGLVRPEKNKDKVPDTWLGAVEGMMGAPCPDDLDLLNPTGERDLDAQSGAEAGLMGMPFPRY
jgi:hypothetical protein